MTRIKRGTTKLKHRRNVLKQTKGYRHGLSKKEKEAKVAIAHAGAHAFDHRRDKKRDYRKMWQINISAAVKSFDLSYSKFIDLLKKKEVGLDRKVLADMAKNNPETFERIVKHVS